MLENDNRAELNKEFVKQEQALIEKARTIVEGNNFADFMQHFKDYERKLLKVMITEMPQRKEEAHLFITSCLARAGMFYEIFEPILQVYKKKPDEEEEQL